MCVGLVQDVWRSETGKTWELVTLSAGWEGRGGHQVALFNQQNQIFLAGTAHPRMLQPGSEWAAAACLPAVLTWW